MFPTYLNMVPKLTPRKKTYLLPLWNTGNDVLSTHHNYGGSFAKKSRFYNLRSENRWNSPSFTLRQPWYINSPSQCYQPPGTMILQLYELSTPPPLPAPVHTHNQTHHIIFPHSFFTDNDLNFIWYLMFADPVFSIYRVSFNERR